MGHQAGLHLIIEGCNAMLLPSPSISLYFIWLVRVMAWIMSLRARPRFSFPLTKGIGFGRAVSTHLHTDGASFHKKCNPGNWKNMTLLDRNVMVCSRERKQLKGHWKCPKKWVKKLHLNMSHDSPPCTTFCAWSVLATAGDVQLTLCWRGRLGWP